MAAATQVGCSVSAAQAFFGGAGTLTCSSCSAVGRFSLTAIGAHSTVVYFAIAAIGFTPVAWFAEQLNIGSAVAPSAGKGSDVIIFYVCVTATAFTGTTISAEYNFFGGFRDVSALAQAAGADKQQGEEKKRI